MIRLLQKALSAFPMLIWLALLLYYEKTPIAVAMLIAVLIHECGHLAAFRLLGEPIPRLSFRALGLCLTPRQMLSYRDEAIVALFGPAFNLATALLLLPFREMSLLCHALCPTSLLLAGIHLLPIMPLDGGRVSLCLARYLLPDGEGERFAMLISSVTLTTALFLSLYFMLFYGVAFVPFFASLVLFREQGRNRE